MGRRPQEQAPELTPRPPRQPRRSRPWWRSRRLRRRLRRNLRSVTKWGAIGIGVLLFVCLVCALFVAPAVWTAAREGRTGLIEGGRAVIRRDADAARVEFDAARGLFRAGMAKLSSPLAWPLRVLPLASTHVEVSRSLMRIGSSVSASGIAIADTMDSLPEQSLAFNQGRVDLRQVRAAHEALEIAAAGSHEIDAAIADMPSGWVGGPLTEPRRQARDELPAILDGVRKAEAALEGLPSILGEGGRKRYVVAFSNLAELRGSGGLFGYVTALEASDGDLDLEAVAGRPTDILPEPGDVGLDYPSWFPEGLRDQAKIFQNVNMTTDFPTVGSFVVATAEPKLGPLDGVIAVDPIGIGAILGLTGPIRVSGWPHAITADNIGKIAMHDVYLSLTGRAQRDRFFAELVRTAFDRLTSTTVRLSAASAGGFDRAIRGGHFRMFSQHAADQVVFDRIGASGDLDRADVATDVLSVVSQNASGNKIDWYLRRDLRYTVRLDPDAGTAVGELSATFRNTAPPSGLPDYVIGSVVPGQPRGSNRQIVTVIRSPRDLLAALTVDGDEVVSLTEREGNLKAYRTTVHPRARGSSELQASSTVADAFAMDGGDRIYRLHVLRQAVPTPDFAEIEISAPTGWRLVGRTHYLGDLTEDVILEVRARRTLIGEPLGAIRRLLRRVL